VKYDKTLLMLMLVVNPSYSR